MPIFSSDREFSKVRHELKTQRTASQIMRHAPYYYYYYYYY